MEDIELKVKVTPEVANIPTTARKTASAIASSGGFSDENGQKRKQVIDQLLGSIDALINKGELTKKEIRELDRYVSALYENLGKAAANTKNVSKEMKALVDAQIAALNKLKEQRDKHNALLEKGKTNERGTVFTSLKGFNDRADAIGIHKVNKDGTLSKRTFNDYETIAANMASGKANYVDSEGKPLADNPEWRKMADQLKEDSEKLRASNLNLEKFTTAVNEATKAVENQAKKEKDEGKDVNPLPEQVGKEQVAAEGAVSAMGTEAAKTQGTFNASLGQTTELLNKQNSSLGKAFKQFTLYAIALRTVKKALHEAVGTIKNLDKYLTEQAMVTGKTRKETYQLLAQYQKMAASLGATTKEVAEVATQFMRQGKTTADALTLTTAAISAAKVAGISAAESVNYLTTALNGFQLSANQAMEVSDKFAAIAAQSATSYEEIATALSKVAAQANLAGMSIDYTTALLAKGIETTREAPETIGTALKTIIARMRELTDYGATLEDGMDINNVETQLAYVGIALRDTNGELRSTEDVLDDLGNAWDTLSSNQQAAVAKALAGTRQQSRLIAMMNDYERVTELQQIAQRSAGATAAQAEVYMQGMEAALNKVSVTWEKIVTTVTDSDVIVSLIEKAANLLEFVNDILSNEFLLTSTLVLVTGSLLLSLIKKWETQKAINRAALEEIKAKRQAQIEEKQKYVLGLKNLKNGTLEDATAKKQLRTQLKINKAKAEAAGDVAAAARYNLLLSQLSKEEAANAATAAQIDAEIAMTESEITGLKIQQTETDLQILQNGKGLVSILGNVLSALTPILTVLSLINMVQQAINAKKLREIALIKENNKEETAGLLPKVAGMFAKVVSAFSSGGIPGVITGIALATALAAALGVGIAASMGAFNKGSAADEAADSVNKLSNEIYKLTEKANAIKTIENQFESLDKKIIKTAEDQEKLNELLDKASDKLSTEREKDWKGKEKKGTSEKEIYDTYETEQEKYAYLQLVEKRAREDANEKRREQIDIVKNLTAEQRKELLTNKENANYLKAQSAIRAIVNQQLYDTIDNIRDVGEATESFTQAILDQMDAEELYNYALDENATAIKQLAETVDKAVKVINGEHIRWTEILDSNDYSFKDRIEAFKALREEIQALGDPTLTRNFNEAYQQWAQLDAAMDEVSLSFMDKVGMTVDRLNDWGLAIQKFGLTTEQAIEKINSLLELVSSGAGVGDAIKAVFDEELRDFEEGSDEWVAAYNKLLNAYQSAVNASILNIGQSMEALHNRINNIYEQAQKWNELSDTEKTTFMNDNADLFSGEDGQRLYEAFKTQNYNLIQQELENNKVLQEAINKRREELQLLLDIEEARDIGDRNEGQIAYLKEQIKLLNETKDIYRASLKVRLEQEQAQLDIYKEFLNKQQDALEESLNKRKDAYSKYFETINQEAEDQEYEEKANLLISNLAKLAGSDDAATKMQSAELETELKQLEADRLRELRERAQEEVLKNIDDQLTDISEKFDKLIENNQLLLQAMTAQVTGDPTGFVSSILSSGMQNLTALGAESFLEEFRTTFGSILPSSALDNISITESTSGDTLILNIAGKEIEIGDSTQQELYTAIMKAMRQLGIK